MPVPAPTLRSINAVLDWYNECDYAAWELYPIPQKKDYRINLYYGKDKDEGTEKLRNELARIQPDDYESYVLVLGAMKGTKDRVFESQVRQVFRLNEKPYGMVGAYGVNPQQAQINNEILNEIRAMRAERLAEIEEEEAEEEEEEQPMTPGSILAGMLQQPRVQEMLINALSSMAGNFARPRVQAVSGTHTQQDMEQILQTLFSKGVTPDDLLKLASMPQSQISMLLSMLRK
jgi:hypothetical protein